MSSGERLVSPDTASAQSTPGPCDPPSPPSPSTLERILCSHPPILDSLFAQITTEDALHLYHTSSYLRSSLRGLPTAWRFISWRLYQPAATSPANANNPGSKQAGNYSLDQLLINVINPYSTCLQSLELDNTAVSGGTLTQTVLILRRETLQHLSVRGCKNVSLKYHINPWLQMHALAKQGGGVGGLFPYDKLALRSLYTYRCRHHRRRPYLPSSLARKESDSEPTHELVKTCHALGIWTDTTWCTTPGSRCFRRRGYVTMRSPQDPREVWVVYDRLWRSKNWLGQVASITQNPPNRSGRKPDARFWVINEKAHKGETVSITGEGKNIPMHLRKSHRKFVEDVHCNNCGDPILERCEQCSVMMHCAGCRKTLCASCAFDRPYLRNKTAAESERHKFWWAPGCAVSPCSMQDQDLPPPQGPPNAANAPNSALPTIKLKWCCSEPVFSGGGGITFPSGSNRDSESLRAAPLPKGEGWEDSDFIEPDQPEDDAATVMESDECKLELAGRWKSLPDFFARNFENHEQPQPSFAPVPRVLCDECHASETWRINCKGCALPLCVKHDMRDRLKVRICGFRDLPHEIREYSLQRKKLEQKWERIMEQLKLIEPVASQGESQAGASHGSSNAIMQPTPGVPLSPERLISLLRQTNPLRNSIESTVSAAGMHNSSEPAASSADRSLIPNFVIQDLDVPGRPLSRGSNCTESASRSSSPAPSASTTPATPEPKSAHKKTIRKTTVPIPQPTWKGCYSFFCPAIRPAGDHRRRCIAVMRQCSECKINVCGDCVGGMDPPCPCRGCQVPSAEDGSSGNESALFFCANCRWSRMATGKCKKFTETFLTAQAAQGGRSRRQKKKNRLRKPLEARRSPGTPAGASDEAAEFLSDFQDMRIGGPSVAEEARRTAELDPDEQGEIQEIEDVGQLARELITRIQTLRGQFRPGSTLALALPDVRLIDDAQSLVLNHPTESDSSSEEPSA